MNIEDIFLFINPSLFKEKIVIGPYGNNSHITIQLGTKSKTLDIHLTNEASPKEYQSLLKIKHSTLKEILNNIQYDLTKIALKYYSNYINLGKLKRFNNWIMPLSYDEISQYIVINPNRKKFNFKKLIQDNDLNKLLLKPEVIPIVDKHALFGIKRNSIVLKGLLFKRRDKIISRSFIFLSKKRMYQLSQEVLELILQKVKDIDIGEYNSLSRLIEKGFPPKMLID